MEESEYEAMYAVEEGHWWFVARRTFLETVFRRLGIQKKVKRTVVDIGAGTGGMETWLGQYGRVLGIEPTSIGRKLAKSRGVMLREGRAEKTGLKAASVDIVCFFDVLYHKNIHEADALGEAWRILKPGGCLVITDCALPVLTGSHDRAVHGARRYTKKSMVAIVERAGFSVSFFTYLFALVFPFTLLRRLWGKYAKGSSDVQQLPDMLNAFFLALCKREARLLKYKTMPWGSSVALVAYKPGDV